MIANNHFVNTMEGMLSKNLPPNPKKEHCKDCAYSKAFQKQFFCKQKQNQQVHPLFSCDKYEEKK